MPEQPMLRRFLPKSALQFARLRMAVARNLHMRAQSRVDAAQRREMRANLRAGDAYIRYLRLCAELGIRP